MLNLKQGLMLRLFLTSLIGFISFLGDKGLQNGKTEIVRALSDNITHAAVGGISWTLVVVLARKSIFENFSRILACFLMASLIDVDHFIAAGSWDINVSYKLVNFLLWFLSNVLFFVIGCNSHSL